MTNNSSAADMEGPTEMEFADPFQCYTWHVQNQQMSYHQAVYICSWYEVVTFTMVLTVLYVLVGISSVVCNGLVLWGIIRKQQLHKPMYLYVANLAVTDFLAGVIILWHVHSSVDHYKPYNMLALKTVSMYSQEMSASALNLLALDRFVAVKYPIFYHNHAIHARRCAGVAIVSSWVVLALAAFPLLMGWSCLEEPYLKHGNCIGLVPLGYAMLNATLMILLVAMLLSLSVIVYKAVKQRQTMRQRIQKERLHPSGANDQGSKGRQENISALRHKTTSNDSSKSQNNRTLRQKFDGQDEVSKRFQSSIHKARTVMIFAIVAVVFWVLALMVMSAKWVLQKVCPEKNLHQQVLPWAVWAFCLNSVVNPLAGISRLADLRESIGQQLQMCRLWLPCSCTCQKENPQERLQKAAGEHKRQNNKMIEIEMGANVTTGPAGHSLYRCVVETAV
ncbi:5-hydroxytryptamine receptor 1F-like [Branchiostoma lanceolatum]|uniref:5-hydroxytryptamine receptor 1F-like n=1 Tax=Branchiostoma lanceolatum TaxID=7740 RepID=UPI003452E958